MIGILCPNILSAQSTIPTNIPKTVPRNTTTASSSSTTLVPSTLTLTPSSMATMTTATKKRANGMDTIVVFSARDSIIFSAKERVLKLRGNAYVNNKVQTLAADQIDLRFQESTMEARSRRDEKGRIIGIPKFSDKGEEFYGDRLLYNFKSQRGLISLAETSMGEGFYFGDKIKRVNETTLFAQDGCYTTCNQPHPHFYFKSPQMKLISNDRIFADPLIVYIEDIPIFIIPFGVFFEHKQGRRSGILIPQFFFNAPGSKSAGTVFTNLGYYFALSDYYDSQITADITTKGGFTLRNDWNYNIRDVLGGSVKLSYGQRRANQSDPYRSSWSIDINHRQTIDPQSNIGGNLSFRTEGFNILNNVDLNSRVQQNITSNFSYARNFDNGMTFSTTYSRVQNIRNGQVTENFPRISFTVPQFFPLKSLVDRESWLSDVAITYSVDGSRSFSRSAPIFRINDTIRTEQTTARIDHNPSINIAPRLGYFNISPSIAYRESWYFRRIASRTAVDDSTLGRGAQRLVDSIENGFFREYNYSFNVGISTRLFGIINPRILGLNSLRHTFSPSISFSFAPSFANNNSLYGTYEERFRNNDTAAWQTRPVSYSRFALDGGGFANRMMQRTMSISFDNNFEAKIAQGDTLPDKVVQLLNVGVNASYNFGADSLKLSPINVNFRTSAGIFNFNGGATLDPYDQQRTFNATEAPLANSASYTTINKFLIEQGKGLARLTRLDFGLQTSLSGDGFSAPAAVQTISQNKKLADTTKTDSAGQAVGERFRARIDNIYEQNDIFGDGTPGYAPLTIPWALNFNFSLNYTSISPEQSIITANLGTSFNLELGGWKIRSSFTYDVASGHINVPSIDITRKIHCWDMTFSWYPSGFSQGFYLRLGISSAMLRDLKLEKRSNPVLTGTRF